MKKALSILLSFVMLLSITAGIDLSAYAATSGDYEYELLDDGTIEITGYNGSASKLIIPSMIAGKKVTSIGESAFYYCESLTSVTIPNGVTSLELFAFVDCSNLENVTLPNSLTYIGNGAFNRCYKLLNITIPNSVTYIGSYAFCNCKSLSSIIIPSSVKTMLFNAFDGCTALTSVTIPNSLEYIHSDTFAGCTSLKSITIPNSITYIGGNAFSGCTNLININIPDTVTEIGSRAFYNTGYYNNEKNWQNGVLYIGNHLLEADQAVVKNCNIKKGTVTISAGAFQDCTKLSSVTIPDSISTIENTVFENCTSLKNITIPNSVISIGNSAFSGCTNLTNISIPDDVKEISSYAFYDTGYYNNKNNWQNCVLYIGNHLIKSDESILGSYTIKSRTITIACDAFENCRKLTNVTMPNSVKYINSDAFDGCSGLKEITLPNSVVKISNYVFYNCTNLTSVKILNKNCEIVDYWGKCIPKETTIYGYKGSTAEAYAKEFGNKFIALCTHKYKTTTTKATTSKNGSVVTKCTVCGSKKSSTTIYYPKTISLSATSYTYDGKVKKPTVTVKDSKGKKVAASNYTVSYQNGRKNVGTYTVTIKFKGNYSGTAKKTFTIKPKATTLSSVTAGKKKFTAKWKKQATQTTGYQIQYSTDKNFKKNNKSVTISKNKTTSKSVSKLSAKKKYYVRVRTYKTVKVNGKSTKIYSSWSKSKSIKTK